MRTLHVAALPFPSPQGTQALIDAMLGSLQQAGHETHLLCYAHGSLARATPYFVHRAPDLVGNRSLTSGPSLAKLGDDAALTVTLRSLVRGLTPDVVVAHHVEAALAVLAAGIRPWLFVAHTSLSAELVDYFSPRLRFPLARLGRLLDRRLCRAATRALAVSPLLASRLAEESGAVVTPLALPWCVPSPITARERSEARRALQLAEDTEVALYAGNLDAYQGLAQLSEGLAPWLGAAPRRRFLVATNESRARLLQSPFGALGAQLLQVPLADESSRRFAHAAADVALVPRKSPGGIPIKLLDALARGLPVLAVRRATCGLSLGDGCRVLIDDEPRAWQAALERLFSEPQAVRDARAGAARDTAAHTFAPRRFVREFVALAQAGLVPGAGHGNALWGP